jgi:hypothetical protein
VSIQVPFARTNKHGAGVRPYSATELYHRSLVAVIREKLANAGDDELFHYEPYELLWRPGHLQSEVKIHEELYTSPAFMAALLSSAQMAIKINWSPPLENSFMKRIMG